MINDKPDWWVKNEKYKRQLDIPEYQPPRFVDDVYTHTVIEPLESEYETTIRFAGLNTEYPEDWHVLIDGEPVATIGRNRDANGNTVYQVTGAEFRRLIETALQESVK